MYIPMIAELALPLLIAGYVISGTFESGYGLKGVSRVSISFLALLVLHLIHAFITAPALYVLGLNIYMRMGSILFLLSLMLASYFLHELVVLIYKNSIYWYLSHEERMVPTLSMLFNPLGGPLIGFLTAWIISRNQASIDRGSRPGTSDTGRAIA